MLQIDQIDKWFGPRQVLQRLSLDIRRGELFTLLGESGCGKTTLLRIIAGLERASHGSVSHGGETWSDVASGRFVPPQKRNLGFVFQNYAIWPHLSVFQQVAYPLRARRLPAAEVAARVGETLALVGLAGFEERPATRLSGGQQQRVAVARAIVGGPDLLLLDEPFSNLDVHLRGQMRHELRELQKKLGLTIVLVTHDQADAFTLSDRIAVMRAGRIEQVAAGEEIYGRPETDFIRGFVGRSSTLRVKLNGSAPETPELVLPGGVRLGVSPAAAAGLPHDGRELVAWIRPEDVAIVEDGEAGGGQALRGTLGRRLFLGDRYECIIRLDDGQELNAYHRRGWVPPADGRVVLRLLAEPVLIPANPQPQDPRP